MKKLTGGFLIFVIATCISCKKNIIEPVDYVNPCIGNISHLLVPTYPTVHLPNSMLRFCPNRADFTSNKIEGFSLNLVAHRSGKVFSLFPFKADENKIPDAYTYDNEKITPYSYQVTLDHLFTEGLGISKWQYYATMPDATGNVGQFVMGNEPSMHISYLYNLAGKPWKTQKRVRMLLDTWFRNDLMGVPGDEDGGGLSAFYVFSAMGFYPITPGIPEYQTGSPLFREIKIHLQNGRTFTVRAENSSADNKYVMSATLNGKPFERTVLTHNEIIDGGTLVFRMGYRPPVGNVK